MAGWRDTASVQAQADMDGLLNAALPLAKQMLTKDGEFYPYGVALSKDGKARLLAAYTGKEHPPSGELVEMLVTSARQEAKELRGVAVVADVRLGSDQGDAIRVEIEHEEGHAIAVVLPYKKAPDGNEVEYGPMAAAAGLNRVWPPRN